jgi:hypothetical protein
MQYLKSGWNWLVFSSADPERISLFVKSVLMGVVTYATILAGLAHITLPSDIITQLIDSLVSIVQNVLMLVAALTGAVGLIRKIGTTIYGTNKVIQ